MVDTNTQYQPDEDGRFHAPTPEPQRASGGLLTRDDILRARDITIEKVDVPEWGGFVYVKGMTAGQRDQLEAAMLDKKAQPQPARLAEFRTRMFILCACHETGAPIFTAADIRAVQGKSVAGINRVLDVARRLSGMTDEDVEELVGNSESDPYDDSSTV
jgi:hypothetical protein